MIVFSPNYVDAVTSNLVRFTVYSSAVTMTACAITKFAHGPRSRKIRVSGYYGDNNIICCNFITIRLCIYLLLFHYAKTRPIVFIMQPIVLCIAKIARSLDPADTCYCRKDGGSSTWGVSLGTFPSRYPSRHLFGGSRYLVSDNQVPG